MIPAEILNHYAQLYRKVAAGPWGNTYEDTPRTFRCYYEPVSQIFWSDKLGSEQIDAMLICAGNEQISLEDRIIVDGQTFVVTGVDTVYVQGQADNRVVALRGVPDASTN